MGWHDFQSPGIIMSTGEAESRRFGFHVLNVRVGVGTQTTEELRSVLQYENYDLAVVRYPSEAKEIGEVLSSIESTIIPTDPTVYWRSSSLAPIEGPPRSGQLTRVGESSLNILVNIITASFAGYVSHWHHNPMTNSINMVDAYIEWTGAVIRNERHSAFVLHAFATGEPIGMALTEMRDDVLEILLAGIIPEYQAQGHYQAILDGVEQYAKSTGCTRVVISTQAGNYRVQTAWARYGWLPCSVLQSVHIRGRHVK